MTTLDDDTVVPWTKSGGALRELPPRLYKPAECGLLTAVMALETQLGTIGAYNALVEAAEKLRAKIERDEAEGANPIYVKEFRTMPWMQR